MTNLTGENFKLELGEEKPVLVGFSAPGCDQRALLTALEQEHGSRMKFCWVDTDRERELARQFEILRAPTLVLLQQGQVLQRIRGERSKEALTRILDLD